MPGCTRYLLSIAELLLEWLWRVLQECLQSCVSCVVLFEGFVLNGEELDLHIRLY